MDNAGVLVAVPDYQTLMRPILALTEDGDAWRASSIREAIVREFQLTPEETEERLPSGRDTTLRNRVGWALTYLYQAGLLQRPRRSVYEISERGRSVLKQHPSRVDNTVLEQFEEFQAFRARGPSPQPAKGESDDGEVDSRDESATPEERAAAAYRELHAALASEVLDRVRSSRRTSSSRWSLMFSRPSDTADRARTQPSGLGAVATAGLTV